MWSDTGISHVKRLSASHSTLEYPRFAITSATSLPFSNESFDMVVMQAFLMIIVSKEDRSYIIHSFISIWLISGRPDIRRPVMNVTSETCW
ncbi:class I SAM-dependent methyltransferase [Methanolobus tindarius]|uniref:class I SAM-dependent methyltransferase n=1 Tax=Methanolobus tindarius TaxID=2221 RepID=UPI001B7FAF80|nr:class I SAM-dependent methyltransferase [Methanolobus tindarius]